MFSVPSSLSGDPSAESHIKSGPVVVVRGRFATVFWLSSLFFEQPSIIRATATAIPTARKACKLGDFLYEVRSHLIVDDCSMNLHIFLLLSLP